MFLCSENISLLFFKFKQQLHLSVLFCSSFLLYLTQYNSLYFVLNGKNTFLLHRSPLHNSLSFDIFQFQFVPFLDFFLFKTFSTFFQLHLYRRRLLYPLSYLEILFFFSLLSLRNSFHSNAGPHTLRSELLGR